MHSLVISWAHLPLFVVLILLFISAHHPYIAHANDLRVPVENVSSVDKAALRVEEMVPANEQGKEMMMMMNESRRKLGSFQICALCTCCGSGAKGGYCLPTPCCYAINCNIPNRPFGFCSLTPKTCNCFGCHI